LASQPIDFGSSKDGRKRGDWKSIYSDKKAKRLILFETFYSITLLVLSPVLLLTIWYFKCKINHSHTNTEVTNVGKIASLMSANSDLFCRYAYAWAGGLYGGAILATKWLYHSIGRGFWHSDRLWWRILSPMVSASVAVGFIWIIDAELIAIFNKKAAQNTPVILGTSFLIGLFSDGAIAKLSEIADVLFGTTTKKFSAKDDSNNKHGSTENATEDPCSTEGTTDEQG